MSINIGSGKLKGSIKSIENDEVHPTKNACEIAKLEIEMDI